MSHSILVVEDDQDLRDALCDTLELAGYRCLSATNGREALELLEREPADLVVSDVQMEKMDGHSLLRAIKQRQPELPVLLMTAYGTIERAVQAMREGALDYLVKPFEAEVLVSRVSRALPVESAAEEQAVARDPAMIELLELAARVAQSDATVLITGESGTGKEVLFRHIHASSARGGREPVALNCAAIPENMLEAMLFGYEKGAFTGAYKSSPGKFEQADGSSLLLDEVSEMSLPLQAKLLRVLQERQVERLGSNKVIELDVRVVASTNRDLKQMVEQGQFREDLYYRLNVFPLHIPPLRERPGDILPLARHLLQRAAGNDRQPPQLSPAAEQRLQEHHWPGNVRELDNVMQRALILCQGGTIGPEAIVIEPARESSPRGASPAVVSATEGLGEDLRGRERRLILEALAEGGGSRKYAAERLGLSPRTLRYKLARMREEGIEIPGDRMTEGGEA
ncbi:MAG: sigma-54-dependent Fis family transcriptional regulator [Gammaproteobacteria bacterium]|nr:MAG: sigma-54-dependent Fis family transcriptional regulator [Gammaproteobacteria bacterium]